MSEWVPAHCSLQKYTARDPEVHIEWWFGNAWANFFAKVGACERKLSDVHVDAMDDQLRIAKQSARLFGWAAAQCASQHDEISAQLEVAADRKVARPDLPPPPPCLAFQEHEFGRWVMGIGSAGGVWHRLRRHRQLSC